MTFDYDEAIVSRSPVRDGNTMILVTAVLQLTPCPPTSGCIIVASLKGDFVDRYLTLIDEPFRRRWVPMCLLEFLALGPCRERGH